MPLMRIPYTEALPSPRIIPAFATNTSSAIAAVAEFLNAPSKATQRNTSSNEQKAVLLTGAGISTASGLADYRGVKGTYTLNRTYRPIYYHEFVKAHEQRKRYWARSFLGWNGLLNAKPNAGHLAVGALGELGRVKGVITQNVDSFHPIAHPNLPTLEIHGYLRSLICLSCHNEYPRSTFQARLAQLNPSWQSFLEEMLQVGALATEDPHERHSKGYRTNPDGDVDVPGISYGTFRYPACPVCTSHPPILENGKLGRIELDHDGAWLPASTAGILKPAVIMFGESIPSPVKTRAEEMIDTSSRLLVVGSSLATYSAWRLVKRAKEKGLPIGILNIGGARGEDGFFDGVSTGNEGAEAVRVSEAADVVLPAVVRILEKMNRPSGKRGKIAAAGPSN